MYLQWNVYDDFVCLVTRTKTSISCGDGGYSCQYTSGTVLLSLKIRLLRCLLFNATEAQLHRLHTSRVPDSLSLTTKSYGLGEHASFPHALNSTPKALIGGACSPICLHLTPCPRSL